MFSNDDDSTVQSQWCEVSLGTDSEQEVRGRLRFRKDSLNSSETDSVESDRSENDVAGTASVLLSGTGSLWFLSLITSCFKRAAAQVFSTFIAVKFSYR